MIMFPTPLDPNYSGDQELPEASIYYYNQRLRNKIFAAVLAAFADEAEAGRITKARLARRLGKRPEQISRWFSGPSNWTIDTVSALLLGMAAELTPDVTFFRNKSTPNYIHPMGERILNRQRTATTQPSTQTVFTDVPIPQTTSDSVFVEQL